MKSLDETVNALKDSFSLVPRNVGEWAEIKLKGMKFLIRSYSIEGIGYLTSMSMTAMLGLMKMDTLVLTARNKDIPLFSYDDVKVGGRRTIILELYDTCFERPDLAELAKVKAKYEYLESYDPGQHWYDSIKREESIYKKTKDGAGADALFKDYTAGVVNMIKTAKSCDPAEKNRLNDTYVDGLLQNGGPAVDVFMKNMGKEKTEEFLKKVLFSTAPEM